MYLIDSLQDDFSSGNIACYQLSVAIFFTLGRDKLSVVKLFMSSLECTTLTPERQVRTAFKNGLSRRIVNKVSEIGECLRTTAGQLFSSVDGEFLLNASLPFVESPGPIDDKVELALDYLSLVQHPTKALSEQGRRKAVEQDIKVIRSSHATFGDVYSGAELAFVLARVGETQQFESMRVALNHFHKLVSRGLIDGCAMRSCQSGTVRWSLACKVFSDGAWKSVVTPFCVSQQMAKLMVMSIVYVAPESISRKSRMPLAKIYDRDRFHRIYRRSKRFIVDNMKVDLESGTIVKSDNPDVPVPISVDLGAVVAFVLKHTTGHVNPMYALSVSFFSAISQSDFSTMIGSAHPSAKSHLMSLNPCDALLNLSSTRHEFQNMRHDLGMPELNKAACLGVSSVLYKKDAHSSSRIVRATANLLELIGDVVNSCGGYLKSEDSFLHIIWYTAIDVNPIIALCAMLKLNFIIQVGGSDIFFYKGDRSDGHRAYDKIEGVMEGVLPDDEMFFPHQASVISSYTNSGPPAIICGGMSGGGMDKSACTDHCISVFFSLMKFLGNGGQVRYLYSDFVLPDACPHFRTSVNNLLVKGFPPRPNEGGCLECEQFKHTNNDFEMLVEEPYVALVKPRMAYAHNRHMALLFDSSFSPGQASDVTQTTVAGIIAADVWRCAKDDSSPVIIPKRKAGRGYIEDPSGTCEESKMKFARHARDEVYELKSGPQMLHLRRSMVSSISLRSGSGGSARYDNLDRMEVPDESESD